MKTTISLLILTLGFMFFTLMGISSGEKIDHHGYSVALSGDISDCIVCHDGKIAPNTSFCIKNCNYNTAHSVVRNYPPQGQEDSYAPTGALLEKGIKLYDGKTTCLSCHNLKNQDRFHLVIDNSGSKLCYTCHISK